MVANPAKHKLGRQHVDLISQRIQGFVERAAEIRHKLASIPSSSAPINNSNQTHIGRSADGGNGGNGNTIESRMLKRLAELQARLGPPQHVRPSTSSASSAGGGGGGGGGGPTIDSSGKEDHLEKQQRFLRRVEHLKQTAQQDHEAAKQQHKHQQRGGATPTTASPTSAEDQAVHEQLMKRLDLMHKSLANDIEKEKKKREHRMAALAKELPAGTRVKVGRVCAHVCGQLLKESSASQVARQPAWHLCDSSSCCRSCGGTSTRVVVVVVVVVAVVVVVVVVVAAAVVVPAVA